MKQEDQIYAAVPIQSSKLANRNWKYASSTLASGTTFDFIYYWNRMGRKGQRCRVLVRGAKNSILVEFEDGFKAVTSRYAVREVKPSKQRDLFDAN